MGGYNPQDFVAMVQAISTHADAMDPEDRSYDLKIRDAALYQIGAILTPAIARLTKYQLEHWLLCEGCNAVAAAECVLGIIDEAIQVESKLAEFDALLGKLGDDSDYPPLPSVKNLQRDQS